MYDRKLRLSKSVSAAILAGAMVFGTFGMGAVMAETASLSVNEESTEARTEAQTDEAETEEKKTYAQLETTKTDDEGIQTIDVSKIVENCMPSIVTVTEKSVKEVMDYFGQKQQYEVEGAASGFIIAQNADELLIATNNHVVEDSTEVTICFSVDTEDPDDVIVPAVVKGTDYKTDLAVVAVSLSDIPEDVLSQLKIAVLGSSDKLKVGEAAITIGNSLGYGLRVTSGIVSALNVDVEIDGNTWTEFETDGAANQGQSGGPVLNSKGEVIGVFNAMATDGDNMGYAIPISTAIPVLQELINRQTREKVDNHGYMGITVVPVSDEASQMYNIPQGAFVYEVTEGSPADKAGLKKGDIITGFDGITIGSQEALLKQIQYYEVGEKVEVTYQRPNGGEYEENTTEMTLTDAPEDVKEQQEKENSDGNSDSDGQSDENSGSDENGGNGSGDSDENSDGQNDEDGSGDYDENSGDYDENSGDGEEYYEGQPTPFSTSPFDFFEQWYNNGGQGYQGNGSGSQNPNEGSF